MLNARDLRLQTDYEQVRALAENSGGRLVIESTKGRPPDEYLLVYHCRTVEAVRDGTPIYRFVSRVRIKLPARYPVPSAPPIVEMRTPIFNPHVYPNRVVCMGSWKTTEYLEDVVLRVGAMLQFDRRYMRILDPANEQAMYWITKNLRLLPTDNVAFRPGDAPASRPLDDRQEADDLRSIGEWMRQAGREEAETAQAETPQSQKRAAKRNTAEDETEAFTGLVEDTSLIWQDIE